MRLAIGLLVGLVCLGVGIPLLREADRNASSEGFLMAGLICLVGAMFSLCCLSSLVTP
jgi:hypothetical protein